MDAAIASAQRDAEAAAQAAAKATKQYIEWTEGEKAVIRALKRVGEIIASRDFLDVSEAFIEAHKMEFEFVDENRLEWTAIHEKYIVLVDETLTRLAKDVDMDELMANLPSFMAGGAQEQDPEQTGTTLDFLMALTDFPTFKNMMLSARLGEQVMQPVVAAEEASSSAMSAIEKDLTGMPPALLSRARELLDIHGRALDGSVKWKTLKVKEGQYELQSVNDGGRKYMRTSLNMGFGMEDAITCFFDMSHPRAVVWDHQWQKLVTHSSNRKGDVQDHCVEAYPVLPGVIKYLASVPKCFPMRVVVQRGVPTSDKSVAIMASWDLEKDEPLLNSRLSFVRVAIIESTGPATSRMFNVAQTPDQVPEWAISVFMQNTILAGVKTSIQRYLTDKDKGLV
mmetsp:Transcript_24674/g.67131  ORF Transcript_24674/g.67131 Transcript_24674/m.67131 type:complete len:395 (+) Transcript_24674:130-1314(+)